MTRIKKRRVKKKGRFLDWQGRRHEAGKWVPRLSWRQHYQYMDDHRRLLTVGFYKVVKFPPEGTTMIKENYKGFRWEFSIIVPVVKVR